MPQYCIPMDVTVQFIDSEDEVEVPPTQDSDVIIIENTDQEPLDASDSQDAVELVLRGVFAPATVSTQTEPIGADYGSLEWSDFPLGRTTEEVLNQLIRDDEDDEDDDQFQYDEDDDQFQCGQRFELDEVFSNSQGNTFPDDDHIFDQIIESNPSNEYLKMMDDDEDHNLLDVLFDLGL
ncbi:uncharacterized protein LOC128264030 [Drosophila gunungcola]|uniref:uncharacterized protein LOC128264030 n=1 Tax=Drosophila gunungcola TaxID=103775 RepID=UPI0022E0559E|nr:uncharacterized protein LOC128264030 [Drosophila gunungcola]